MIRVLSGVCLTAMLVATVPALAQSDPSGFTTVINVPPTSFGDGESIGSDTQLNIADGGTIGLSFDVGATDGTSTNIEVNMTGGNVGFRFHFYSGSSVNVSGGRISSLAGYDGSILNFSGGQVDALFRFFDGSTANFSGGIIDKTRLEAWDGSTLNILGSEFVLDGVPLDLQLGQTLVITQRDVTLTGFLADGSAFDFLLDSTFGSGANPFFDSGATLTVTNVIPEPVSALLFLAGLPLLLRRQCD